MATLKITEVPQYRKLDIVGKTKDSNTYAGTSDRRKIRRTYITLEDVPTGDVNAISGAPAEMTVLGDKKGYGIRKVEKAAETKLYVQLEGAGTDGRSLAGWTIYDAYKAPAVENNGVDLFIPLKDCKARENLDALLGCAAAMCKDNARVAGRWFVCLEDGTRVFPRLTATNVGEGGRINECGCCCDEDCDDYCDED